jgi:PAS domain S-box-containing protein
MSAGVTAVSRYLLAKVLVTIVVVYLVIGVAAIYGLDALDRQRHATESFNRISQLISSTVSALENLSAGGADTASRRELVADILEVFSIEPDVLCVEVADQQNALVIAHWPDHRRCEANRDVTRVTVTLDDPSPWQLNVVIGSENLQAELFWETRYRIMLLLGSLLAVSAILFASFHYWVNRPIKLILDAMEVEREDGAHQALDYDSPDELGQLALAMNTLMATLEQRDISLTEYKQALSSSYQKLEVRAEQLARGESLFVAAFDSAPVGVALRSTDPENPRFMRVNEQFCKMLGYTSEELTSLNVWDITPKDEQAEARQYISFLESGSIGPYTREKRYLRKDGSELWASISVAPVLKEDGKVLHFVAIIIDISAEKMARAERDSMRRLTQDLLDFMPAEVAVVDNNRRFQIRNNSHRKNHPQFNDLEPVPMTASDSMALLSGQPMQREETDEGPEGLRYALAQRFPLRNQKGELYGHGLIRTDITELKSAELQLRQTEAWYREIFELAPEGMLIIDDHGVIHLANDGVKNLLGYRDDEMQGKTVSDLVPEHFREEQGRHFKAFLNSPPEFLLKHEVMALKNGGGMFPVEIKLRRLPKLPDRPQFVSVAVRSLVAQREMQKVTREARKLAEQAARTKSDFLANMSHEIRTPLNAIIGMSRLAMDQSSNARQRDQLSKVLVSARHLLGIVGDILDVSKIEAGKLVLEQIEFAIDKVLADSATMVAQQCSAKGLELILNVDPAIPRRVLGDPLRLSQVIANYTNNALKFTEHGEIEIHAELLRKDDAEVLIKLSVRDTGIGMTHEQISRLFQSFQQADPSISRRYGGTGLGLAICKRFSVMMGGEVGVDSEIGHGSTFWFTAKLKVPEQLSVPVHKANPEGHRVLVVDDNPTVRRVLLQMLRGFGLIVDEARSGIEAIERCLESHKQGFPYDVAFVDLMMAGIDGIEVIKRLHAQVPSQPRLVAVSGFMSGPLQRQAELAGAQRVLQKPLHPSVLLEMVTELVGGEGDLSDSKRFVSRVKPKHLNGISVLLVEDNVLNQEVAAAFLEDWGCEVSLAGDGAQALHLVQENSYDLVLMDIQMPLMDGLEATRAIRVVERLVHLPIVAMTANAMPRDRERCLEAGMNDHISKPIDPDRLLKVILQMVSRAPLPEDEAQAMPLPRPRIEIEGIDTDSGMKRVVHNADLYQSMLRRFVEHAAEFAVESEKAHHQQDWPTLERLAHTLKSTALLIGAGEVSHVAVSLEAAIHEQAGADQIAELTISARHAVDKAAEAIRAWLDQHRVGAVEIDPHGGGGAQLVQELREYLLHDDARTLRLCRDNGAALAAVLGARFEAVKTAVERFDFVSALDLLDEQSAELADVLDEQDKEGLNHDGTS